MTERIVTDANGRKHITTEPMLHAAPTDANLSRDEVMRTALVEIIRMADRFKAPCTPANAPETPAAIRNGAFATIAQVAAQGLGILRGPSFVQRPLSREQRRAMIESAINDCDDEGLRPDMERFAWLIDAVERAHGIRAA